jgi:hypothetical protein
MRKWNVVAAVLAFGFIMSPFAAAQQDGLRDEVNQLKNDLKRVMSQNQQILSENAELRTRVDGVEDNTLEERINALAESLDYAAGTTVNSVANPITITGEFRIRSGWTFDRDFGDNVGPGAAQDEDDNGSFHDARFRVAFDFDFSRDVTTHFSMQANGLFENDDVSTSNTDLSDIDLYEGWILVRNIFGRKELSAKSGRQEIVFGNEFIFGNNDFFSGETHDGTVWTWSADNFDVNVFMTKMNIQESLNVRNHPYASAASSAGFDDDEMYGVYFTLKSLGDHVLDLFWVYMHGDNDFSGSSTGTLGNNLNSGLVAATDEFFYHTVGLRLGGTFNVSAGLDYNINFAYQFGDIDAAGTNGNVADVDAFAVEVEVGITFNANNNFRLYVRFLFSEGADGSDVGFIHLFPERHAQANRDDHTAYRARYGLMDIIPMSNVMSIQLGATFDPAADWTLGLVGIWAQTDEDVLVSGDDEIGIEIDAFAEYRYSAETTFSIGVGIFLPNDSAPYAGGGFVGAGDDDIAVLLYLQTRVVF